MQKDITQEMLGSVAGRLGVVILVEQWLDEGFYDELICNSKFTIGRRMASIILLKMIEEGIFKIYCNDGVELTIKSPLSTGKELELFFNRN